MTQTNFKIDIQELKERATEFNENGFSYKDTIIGTSIEAHLTENHILFYNHHIQNLSLNEYILFYCFKFSQYSKSYKHENNGNDELKFFQISEITYDDIYKEISSDATNFESQFD